MTEGKLTQSDHQCRVRNNMSKVNSHPHHQNHHDAICMSSLSLTGYIWALLSLCGVMATALGFFMPFWLQGEMSPQFNNTVSYLGIFRRCYYPAISSDNGEIMIVSQCGHYSRFSDIPSVWWQVTTILVGISACLSFVISLISLLAVCLDDVLTKTSACIMGAVQFMAGLCIAAGCLLYPLGWECNEARQVCGADIQIYNLGNCTISWAYYCAMGSGCLCFINSVLARYATKKTKYYN